MRYGDRYDLSWLERIKSGEKLIAHLGTAIDGIPDSDQRQHVRKAFRSVSIEFRNRVHEADPSLDGQINSLMELTLLTHKLTGDADEG